MIQRTNQGSFGTKLFSTQGQIIESIGFTPVVGRKLLFAISHSSQATIDRMTQPGVVWTRIIEGIEPSVQNLGTKGELWHGDVVGPSPSDTLTMTISTDINGDVIAVCVHEIDGLRGIWPAQEGSANNGTVQPMDTGSAGLNFVDDAYFFAAACQSSSDPARTPDPPTNGFSGPILSEIGTDPNPNVGHRCTTAEKIVSQQETAKTTWSYAGFSRWVGAVGIWRADTDVREIEPVQQKEGSESAATSVELMLDKSPVNVNTMLLALTISGNNTGVSVVQTGATWVRDAQKIHTNTNVTTEIWRTSLVEEAVLPILTVNVSGSSDIVASVQEFSGILKPVIGAPLEQVVTAEGNGDPISSGQTAGLALRDELLFASIGHTSNSVDIVSASGFLRGHQITEGSVTGASFVRNETYPTVQYEVQAFGVDASDWVGAIAAYKSAASVDVPGLPMNIYSDERNQGGTTTVISGVSSPVNGGTVSAGNFVDGHRHLILASARGESFNGGIGFRLNITGAFFDVGTYRPFAPGASPYNEMYGASRVRTLANSDSVALEALFVSGNPGSLRQSNLVILDLDSGNFVEGRDWFNDENTTLISQMNDVFEDNIGSELRFRADGVSTYLLIGHARLEASVSTSITADMAMQLWDVKADAELGKAGWQRWLNVGERRISMNVMAVVRPPAGTEHYQIRCVGGTSVPPDGWDHVDSSIVALRLEQFAAHGYGQDLELNQVGPGNRLPPTAGAVDAQASFVFEPDTLGEMVTMAFTQADNSLDDTLGIGSQARFPGISGSDRSLWDTENATLGGTVQQEETNNGDSNGGAFARIPTWGVSHRTGVTPAPGTVEWFNAGRTGNASQIDRVSIVSIGKRTAPAPFQTPAPTPVPPPQASQPLQEKAPGVHEQEAFDNQLEQFKP